jgi:hypothetical protein
MPATAGIQQSNRGFPRSERVKESRFHWRVVIQAASWVNPLGKNRCFGEPLCRRERARASCAWVESERD